MTVQRLSANDFDVFENPGVAAVQIVWVENAPESKVTIERQKIAD